MNKYLEKIALNKFESHVYEQAGNTAKSVIAAKFGNQGIYLGAARKLRDKNLEIPTRVAGKRDILNSSANLLVRESRKVK